MDRSQGSASISDAAGEIGTEAESPTEVDRPTGGELLIAT
jgi:hypothetical protein